MSHYSSKMMNKDEIFSIWAPDDSPWSGWAKPVLFAYTDSPLAELPVTETTGDLSWCPEPSERAALVLDLPGAEGVLNGVALATRGYRPVPLYNAVPLPFGEPNIDSRTGRAIAAVDVAPIISALRKNTESLAALKIPTDAPPVFLLDANRSGGGRNMEPDEFDNRSVSFTTDFPSANFFLSRGIERVILVQRTRIDPRPDLAHSLKRWQDAGFILERKQMDSPNPLERFEGPRPTWYGAMFQRVLLSLGLRRAGSGGFGAWVPESSAGG
jgi:hypothetical protein